MMNKIKKLSLFVLITVSTLSLSAQQTSKSNEQSISKDKEQFIKENIEIVETHVKNMLKVVGEPTGKNYPRTMNNKGQLVTTNMYDWTPGFFPGTLWYIYELTGKQEWKTDAEKWTNSLERLKTFTRHHDLGFMMYCSYGNANRLAPKPEYNDILIESANSLSTRYDDRTKAIKSWNVHKSWDGEVVCYYPVIIDNMMNLEMLFDASKLSGDKRCHDIAVTHAETTLKNHFREDFSSYHVVDYDTITGDVKHLRTAQGYSNNSMWARGQAWAIYGYTMTYRETKNPVFLDAAIKMTDVYLERLPENDLIPLWDFNVGQEGYTPDRNSYAAEYKENLKDISAAAVVCSALFELAQYAPKKGYQEIAIDMLKEIASPKYRAEIDTNADFILKHSVGSIPHKTEIDKPLVYADYYFLEALVRYKNLKN